MSKLSNKVPTVSVTETSITYDKKDNKNPSMIKRELFKIGSVTSLKRFYAKMTGPIELAIKETLTENLEPIHLEIINESHMHNVPKGSESHFKVLVVSPKFENIPLIKRHRMVNDLVKSKLEGDFVHALSIVAKSPDQWDSSYVTEPSPNCRGGFGK